ncbi:MAG: hypothetical protein ACPGSB_09260, partial [Opitutales bacterium]
MRTTMKMPSDPKYFEDLGRLAPSHRFIMENPGCKVGRMSDMMTAEELEQSEFYHRFMKPEGWRYAAALFFWNDEEFIGHLSFTRTADQGDYTDEELHQLRMVYRDILTAVNRVRVVEQ